MKTKSNVKAGLIPKWNHNETLVSVAAKAKTLKVKTSVKAGFHDVTEHR
jgi:hypothetical protein